MCEWVAVLASRELLFTSLICTISQAAKQLGAAFK